MGGTVSNIYNCVQSHENHDEGANHCHGFGTGVIIRGDDGRWYQYAHMQAYSIPSNVYVGAYVPAGAKVGKVGNTGNSTGNHLHFQINTTNAWNGPVNPQAESYSGQQTSYFTSVWADNITGTDATIHATIYGTNLSTCGFYIGKSQNAMEKRTETVNGYVENIWYTLGSDYGTLQPGTTYYYKFFITVSGTEYCSDVKSFKTSGNTYTISYNANGGTGAPASQTKAQGTTLIITETVPTRKGYTFLGWSTSSTATTATYCAGSHFTTDANTTLYAVWKADEISGLCGENNLTWHLNVGTGVMTIFGNGAMDDYSSSSEQPWYTYRDSIKTVVINNGVTKIGRDAFYGCTNLVNISIGNDVTGISTSAFSNTGYYKNTSNWENGVLYIDEYLIASDQDALSGDYAIKEGTRVIADVAFILCKNLTNVTIPNSVITIGRSAFYACENLENVDIPSSVTTIGSSVFSECTSLTNITVDKNNQNYSSDEYGVLFNKDKTTLIAYPQGNARKSYEIPDSVTKIDDYAFYTCTNLTSVEIPDGVTTIGLVAFYGCKNLTSVEIPDGVTTIEQQTFYGCTNLKTVTIPDSVTIIGQYAFYRCENLTCIEIPAGVTEIDSDAFYSCKNLTNIVMANSVKKIGIGTFEGCSSLTDVYYIGTEEQWNEINISSSFHGSDNNDLINANRHYCEERIEKQPTCEEDGYTAGLYCTECKEFVKDAQVIPATGHNYNSVETNPTCTETGYTTYTCACGDSYIANETPAIGHSYNNGVCVNCGKADSTTPSEPDTPDEEFSINIQRPSRTTIRYKDGIILHANIEGELPEGAQVTWYVSNDNFDGGYLDDGMSCVFVSKNNGYTTIYAVIEDANGIELAVDSIELRSKAGFFDKIGGFFRSLFGSTTIYEY